MVELLLITIIGTGVYYAEPIINSSKSLTKLSNWMFG